MSADSDSEADSRPSKAECECGYTVKESWNGCPKCLTEFDDSLFEEDDSDGFGWLILFILAVSASASWGLEQLFGVGLADIIYWIVSLF